MNLYQNCLKLLTKKFSKNEPLVIHNSMVIRGPFEETKSQIGRSPDLNNFKIILNTYRLSLIHI